MDLPWIKNYDEEVYVANRCVGNVTSSMITAAIFFVQLVIDLLSWEGSGVIK